MPYKITRLNFLNELLIKKKYSIITYLFTNVLQTFTKVHDIYVYRVRRYLGRVCCFQYKLLKKIGKKVNILTGKKQLFEICYVSIIIKVNETVFNDKHF
jgi:hypothetical protein